MKQAEILEKVTELVKPEIAALGLDLFEIEFKGGVLRITIDKPQGVGLDDCVAVNRRVGLLLDAEDLISGKYRLEVTSPGLNRKLKSLKDFEYFSGRKARVVTQDGSYTGIISGLDGDKVLLKTDDDELSIGVHAIIKANLEFDF